MLDVILFSLCLIALVAWCVVAILLPRFGITKDVNVVEYLNRKRKITGVLIIKR